MCRRSFVPNQITSGEMTATLPKRCPTNSGCNNGRLFFGTLSDGAPTLVCLDRVICGCGKTGVSNDWPDSTTDNSAVPHPLDPVPQSIRFFDILYLHQSSIR